MSSGCAFSSHLLCTSSPLPYIIEIQLRPAIGTPQHGLRSPIATDATDALAGDSRWLVLADKETVRRSSTFYNYTGDRQC
jgi:hypothetical protein